MLMILGLKMKTDRINRATPLAVVSPTSAQQLRRPISSDGHHFPIQNRCFHQRFTPPQPFLYSTYTELNQSSSRSRQYPSVLCDSVGG